MRRACGSRGFWILILAALPLGVLLVPTYGGGGSNRSIQSIATTATNQLDPQSATDSTTVIRLNLTGGAAAAETPDSEAGFRLEIYNSAGTLVRRLASEEIDGNATLSRSFNGRNDSDVALPYGSYTLRAYSSMRDPVYSTKIQGEGITIDRPGDLHVTSGGVLSWSNGGSNLGFCQVALGDPNNEEPTFLRLVDYTIEPNIGATANTDRSYGIVMNSVNQVFITHNDLGEARIAKYNIATETGLAYTWASDATTAVDDDEWVGLGIDSADSVYVAGSSNVPGGGNGGTAEVVARFRDNGLTGTVSSETDAGFDYYDVAPHPTPSTVWGFNYQSGRITRLRYSPLSVQIANVVDIGGTVPASIWITYDSSIFGTDADNDRFRKYRDLNGDGDVRDAGEVIYEVSTASQSPNGSLEQATGIAVWTKTTTGETFVLVGSRARNQISIWKENAAGDSVTFVRLISDDPSNLNDPVAIAIGPSDSAIYVVSNGQRAIKKFSSAGVFQNLTGAYNGKFIQGNDATGTLSDSSGFVYPSAVAVDDTGNIYVFDHSAAAAPTHSALKKFGPTGTPLGIIWDIDATDAAFNSIVYQAIWKNNSIYTASAEPEASVMRISNSGTLLQHLGAGAMGADAAEGNVGSALGVYAVAVAPFFDTSTTNNPRWYPDAVYILNGDREIEVWTGNFSATLSAPALFTNPALNDLLATHTGFMVDDFGEVYVLENDVDGSGYEFNKFNAATRDRNVATNGMLEYIIPNGTGNDRLQTPLQMIWSDDRGNFTDSGSTAQDFWIADMGNNRLVNYQIAWHDRKDTPIILRVSQDTPTVSSVTITGETVTTIGGTYYVGRHDTGITIQVNFSLASGVGLEADTQPTIRIYPNISGTPTFVTVDSTAYPDGGTSWTGTTAIKPTYQDGTVEIKVENAWDQSGAGAVYKRMSPDPDQTDFDAGDDFKPFIIDQTAPVYTVSDPPSGGASTTSATYTVTGQVTSDATGKDAQILLENYTELTGGTLYHQTTIPAADAGTGNFSGSLNLQPAPSNNYVQVTAIDKLGNRASLSARRLVTRTVNVGNAFIEPSSSIQVNTLRSYELRYTAAQDVTADTLRFVIPSDWSDLQTASSSSNGFFRITTAGTYTESQVSGGETLTILGVTLSIGQTLSVWYGDSTFSLNGRARPSIDAPLSNAANTFKAFFQQDGDTQFTAVSAQSGKTLTIALYDSDAAVAVQDTDVKQTNTTTISKGSDTRVMTVRITNSNIGNHTNRVSSFVLRAENDAGSNQNWNTIASRVVVKNTQLGVTYATVTTIPASPNLTITPTTDIKATAAADSIDIEIWVEFASTASADSARFYFSGPSDFTIVDDLSGNALTVYNYDTGITRKSGIYDIFGLQPADTASYGADTSFTTTQVSTGQKGVELFDIYVKNEADTQVNDIRIDRVLVTTRTAAGASLVPRNVISAVYLKDADNGTSYGATTSIPSTGETVQVDISKLVASGVTVKVRVSVDIAGETAGVSSFRMGLTETTHITAKDNVTGLTARARDDPSRGESMPFLTDTIVIQKVATATLNQLVLMDKDTQPINGELGTTLTIGEVFYVRLNYADSPSRGTLRVEPSDTDLTFFIGGADRTSEFTINTKSPATTIAAGLQDTITYGVVQNLGTTSGILTVQIRDTNITGDTRPRLFDQRDYFNPDKLRAIFYTEPKIDTVSVVTASQEASARSVGTSYANAGEQNVPILSFTVTNNQGSGRFVDSVTVEAISANSSVVTAVKLWSDHEASGHGVFSSSQDTLVASGTLGTNDTVLLALSPQTSVGPSDTRIFFVTFDFAGVQTDGDTFDAQIPAQGISFASEPLRVPSSSALNSSGAGVVEIVATRVTASPDTQIVAVGASPNLTLNAVDSFGNLDNTANVESSVQGHNLQVEITLGYPDADSTHYISATAGLNNVSPAVGPTVRSINANLSGGAGTITMTDNEAESFAITIASTLNDSSAVVQFANLISASAVNFGATSASPDSEAFQVLRVLITNSSGQTDTLTTFGIVSLNSSDTNLSAVGLWADSNSNNRIDSFADSRGDTFLAVSGFSNGKLEFTGLSLRLLNGETRVLMVGYDLQTTVTDNAVLDARADTVTVALGGNLAGSGLNSNPAHDIEVTATHIDMEPQTGTSGTGSNVTVYVEAQDDLGNHDADYTDGGSALQFGFTGSAFFTATTLANEDIIPPTTAIGDLVNGAATLTFTDNSVETVVLSCQVSPGLSGVDDTGTFRFEQGFTITALDQSYATVQPSASDRVLLRFRVQATGTSDSVASVSVTWRGTSTADVTNVRMYRDADTSANESFNLGADRFYGAVNPGSFSSETIVFNNDTVYVANGTSRVFYLVADVAAGAVDGDTLDVELRVGSIRTSGNLADIPSGIRNSTGWETVVVLAASFTVDSIAVGNSTVVPGSDDVVIERYRITNTGGATGFLNSIVIRNSGTHLETGIFNVEVWIDSQPDGTLDTSFGTAGAFSNGARTFTGSAAMTAGDSLDLYVRYDLSDTLSHDSFTLNAYVAQYELVFSNGDSRPLTGTLNSNGTITVGTPIAGGNSNDSWLIRAGSGIANNKDTVFVSVTIRDTAGVPAHGRSVDLTGDLGLITVVSADPASTDLHGVALFALRTGTAGSYQVSATVDGVAMDENATVTFISENLSSGNNLGGNPGSNTQIAVVSGNTKHYQGNIATSPTTGPAAAYIEADGTNWKVVYDPDITTIGGTTNVLSLNRAQYHETGQVDFLSALEIANTQTSAGTADYALAGIIHRSTATSRRPQIYAVKLDGSGDSYRLTPNNPFTASPGSPFTTTTWRFFSMNPSGETVVVSLDGNLATFFRQNAATAWDPVSDSGRIRYLTNFSNAYGVGGFSGTNTKVYAAYPSWSPDGTRIALSIVWVSDNFSAGPAVNDADIYVIPNYSSLVQSDFVSLSPPESITAVTQSYMKRIVENDGFAFMPRWTPDGSGIVYSVAQGPDWDWQRLFRDYPYNNNAFDSSKFVTKFIYYDKNNETAPYAPITISDEGSVAGALDIAMPKTGAARLSYIRKSLAGGVRQFEVRTVGLSSEATISSAGGVLFDSGRIAVVVPDGANYGAAFKIASSKPSVNPGSSESTIITGAAKSFYSPADPDSPVYFSDSVVVFLYYGTGDFSAEELIGYDGDGDGIPDRTEAAVSAYYWNGTEWIDYGAVRYPGENKIEFKTDHFSSYAVGLSSEVRALAFNGTVHDIVAYPNPWRIDGPTSSFAPDDNRYGIKFTNFPGADVRIRIYTLAGELVLDETVNALNNTSTSMQLRVTAILNNARGTVSWNLRNRSGREVASGVYLAVFEGPGGRATRKVAIIR